MGHALLPGRTATEKTAVSSASGGDHTGPATGDLGQAPGGGNQAVLSTLASEGGLGDPVGASDVDLDQILGEGAQEQIEGTLQQISDLHLAGISAFADVPLPCDEWLANFDGAMDLAERLDSTASALTSTATYDEDGEVVSDPDLQFQVEDLLTRTERALPILDAVLLLARQDMLVAFADALDRFGTAGLEQLELLRVHAETGSAQMQTITEEFRKHQELYEKYLIASSKDALSLAIGGIGSAFTAL